MKVLQNSKKEVETGDLRGKPAPKPALPPEFCCTRDHETTVGGLDTKPKARWSPGGCHREVDS